ncbi:MAG: thiaminase II [Alphaproteobacteria bacterium]|jgi:thiaminase/transcriptional activator TenA|nr:thiaminase II [Alphaproteobacteria bacterium]MDP6516240.1 thiaminase II [Alphaproteobacteria bacterium]
MSAVPRTPETGLFARLRTAAGTDWDAYCRHRFVAGMADGSLPEAAFRHYLTQDTLFLIQFARAYALAAYKSETLADLRAASAAIAAIVDVEMGLHLSYCARWRLDESGMLAVPEDLATTAYTRYVLDCGLRGDLLDLEVALAPCVIGYGEIGRRLAADPATRRTNNPYADWIDMYAGTEYQALAADAGARLDDLWARRGGPGRFEALAGIFTQATRLEIAFWQMGWDAGLE